jgi:hypothetical protein
VTPSGRAYASNAMLVCLCRTRSDSETVHSRGAEAMPGIMKKVEAATAHLPPVPEGPRRNDRPARTLPPRDVSAGMESGTVVSADYCHDRWRASRRGVASATGTGYLAHRGAVAMPISETGDGANIHIDLHRSPNLRRCIVGSGHKPPNRRTAVGMIFLPRTDLGAQESCRTIVESERDHRRGLCHLRMAAGAGRYFGRPQGTVAAPRDRAV